jgi:2-succinyl-5-enolpyruvyl-6-hydroxy-3-cyclohexene-1-carboxylate synthase
MLEQARLPELDELFITPHPATIAAVCAAAGAAHELVERATGVAPAIERALREGGVQVIEVAIDAPRDRTRRAELRDAVADALSRR